MSLSSVAGLDQGVIIDPQVNRPLAQGLAKSPQQQHVHKQVVRPLKMRLFYPAPRAGVKFSRYTGGMRLTALAALAVTLLAALPASAQRLPTTVTPVALRPGVRVDLNRERFEGTETIRVQVGEADVRRSCCTRSSSSSARSPSAPAPPRRRRRSRSNEASQTATLTVPQPLAKGATEIHVRFSGVLNTQLRGFYISKTKLRKYAVTQFESTDARRAFPCFDEPAFKATFALTLTIDRGDTAICQRQACSRTCPGPAPTQHTMKFSTTAKMSSYLVAMAVGDFKCVEGAADDIPIRICATPDKRELTHLALESAQQILKLLQLLLRHQISVRQARRRRRAGFRGRRDGEHRRDLLSRDRSARRDEVGVGRHPQEHRVDPRARDGAPVVRRSRDDGSGGTTSG